MNKITSKIIRKAIQNLSGNDFQDFANLFYLIIYRDNFQSVKQKRDRGCDGIINGRRIISVYAPEDYNTKTFERKIHSDFNKYESNFLKDYPEWQFVYNRELTTGNFQFLKGLFPEVHIEDINTIMCKIESDLNWTQKVGIFDFLGIERNLWYNDILMQVSDDLIRESESETGKDVEYRKHQMPNYIEDKIRLNYEIDDVEAAKQQYDLFLEDGDFDSLRRVLCSFEENIGILKKKLIGDYLNTGEKLSFKERLQMLIDRYSSRYNNDDTYRQAVTVIIIYYFEYCLIGRKTEGV